MDPEQQLHELEALLRIYLAMKSADGKVERRALRAQLRAKVGMPVEANAPQ